MSQFEVVMPKLGESITEATITKWFKKEGDSIEEDDPLLEIATDKVDSEIPSPVAGLITKILFGEGDVVPVGKVIATIALEGEVKETDTRREEKTTEKTEEKKEPAIKTQNIEEQIQSKTGRFYSPLVKTIAKQENISAAELDTIPGTGQDGRVRKEDILHYIENRTKTAKAGQTHMPYAKPAEAAENFKVTVTANAGDEVVEMDRMRRLIADHMVASVHTSAHVTNFLEADVTNMVLWRNKVKDEFKGRENIPLTYTSVFLEAIVKALKDYPILNASIDGYKVILHKKINLGMAVALPTNNLIVPVIKNADNLNLRGLAAEVFRLAEAARNNKLSPDDVQGGTFTLTNFGTFRNAFGTPIINQPQVAILATGNIEKKPAVLETPTGDVIAIRHKMFLGLTYDHRLIDGALGGIFLRRIADYLEQFDINQTI
jgi:2-oxoglutarate dehydrogenase E2 component (dihydrolipoamide succinyltransferase)